MKAVKVLVVAMGVVLIGGFAALFVTWNTRHTTTAAAPKPLPIAAVTTESTVDLPPGHRVVHIAASAAHVDLLVEGPDGHQTLYQNARASGRVTGIIHFP